MEKVFSKDLWLKDMLSRAKNQAPYYKYYNSIQAWQNQCEGKTKKECLEIGFKLDEKWFK